MPLYLYNNIWLYLGISMSLLSLDGDFEYIMSISFL